MKKIFIASFPFDEKDTGDYDYCVAIANAINSHKDNRYEAKYITSADIPVYDPVSARSLLAIIKAKNNGGIDFYNSLDEFYANQSRQHLVKCVIDYMVDEKGEQTAIFNLQLRPPETGFLFSPQDLLEIKKQDFKICITCHEYELNFDRQWLQSIMHHYFSISDSVLFFNKQDQMTAISHARYTAFSDHILPNLTTLPNTAQQQQLKNFLTSKTQSNYDFYDSENITSILITKKEIKHLECKMFIGEINYNKGESVRYSIDNNVTKAKPPIHLEWGIRQNVIMKSDIAFTITGIIFNPINMDIDCLSIKASLPTIAFKFDHKSYELDTRSTLTKVPPTTADINNYRIETFLAKPPNIIIFGLVRNGKGFEDALTVIQKVHCDHKGELPNTRLIIVGKASSYELLAEILNAKFGFEQNLSPIDSDFLKSIDTENLESTLLKQQASAIIDQALKAKKNQIKQILIKTNFYKEGDEDIYVTRGQEQSNSHIIKIEDVSPLQHFIIELTRIIPERLPIDIYLDISKADLPKIFTHAKYAIKYDEKGWADNASGLINLLAYGTILYTGWGMCTDSDTMVNNDSYKEAIILPHGQYGLKEGENYSPTELIIGKRLHYDGTKSRRNPNDKKLLIKAEDIIADIIQREEKVISDYQHESLLSSGDNELSFMHAAQLLRDKFDPMVIAGDLIEHFDSL